MSDEPDTEFLTRMTETANMAFRSGFSWPDIDRLIALARLGAAVKPRPISEAMIEDGSFIAFVDVTNNKTGKTWTESHLVWIDEDTGEIAVDCEQGWRLEDYHSFIPLTAIPKPQDTP